MIIDPITPTRSNPKGGEIQVLPEFIAIPDQIIDLLPMSNTKDGYSPPIYNGGQPYTSPGVWNPDLHNDTTPVAYRINWFKILRAAAAAVPIIGGVLAAIVDELANKSTVGISGEELTSIQAWIKDIFMPFIIQSSIDSVNAMTRNLTLADIGTVNQTLTKLCIIKQYFQTNDNTTFLSEAALDYRYELIAEMCDKVAQTISDNVASSGLLVRLETTRVNGQDYQFNPLITLPVNGTFNCVNYKTGAATSTSVKTITTLPEPGGVAVTGKTNTGRIIIAGLAVATIATILLWPDKKAKRN